jgi:hypothetical protein
MVLSLPKTRGHLGRQGSKNVNKYKHSVSHFFYVNFSAVSVGPKLKATEARPRFCGLCDKQFYFDDPFQVHLKSVHTDGAQPGSSTHLRAVVALLAQFFEQKWT